MTCDVRAPRGEQVAACLAAAHRLRAGVSTTVGEQDRFRVAVGRLLESIALALARDPAAVPVRVRRAAEAVAREAPAKTATLPGAEPEAPSDLRRPVPFTASVRLGRMG